MVIKAGFLIGGDTNETPQTLARKRALIAQIMANGRAPTTIGEGLNALGDGIVANVLGRRADAAEAAGLASANDAFSPIAAMLTGGYGANTSTSSAAPRPSSAPSPVGQPPIPGIQTANAEPIDISGSQADFINAILPSAIEQGKRTGIDPRIIVAQAAHESGWGKHAPGNNLFGIKSHGKPGGQKLWTNEVINGRTVRVQDDFRQYDNPADSLSGYSDFILENPRYGKFRSAQGLDAQLAELGASGYASDPNYTNAVGKIARGVTLPTATTAVDAVNVMGSGGSLQPNAYVDPMVSAPNSRPQAIAPQQGPSRNGLPFDLVSGSPQLAKADTRRGILRALTGQTGPEPGATGAFPAAPPSATMPAPQSAPAPSVGAPAPTQATPAPQPPQISTQQLIAAINNPWLNDSQRAVAQSMLEQQMQANDPMRQLQLEKLRKEVEGTGAGEVKIAGDRAFLIKPDGSVTDVTPSVTGQKQDGFRFTGSSVEAQALNGLIDSGQITPEQAQQLGAGKTITGPNGEIIFMTPQGVFGQSAQGGEPQPITPGQETPSAPQRTNIPITEPKVTLDEKKAMTFADRMVTSGDLIDKFGAAGTDKTEVMKSQIPFGLGNMIVGEDFQKFDQARRDFINAQLRRESGAVISDQEFDNANKQYFPQPGDTPDVLRQKADNRRVAIEGMIRDGGPTYKPPKIEKPAPDINKPISEMTDEELEAIANGN